MRNQRLLCLILTVLRRYALVSVVASPRCRRFFAEKAQVLWPHRYDAGRGTANLAIEYRELLYKVT